MTDTTSLMAVGLGIATLLFAYLVVMSSFSAKRGSYFRDVRDRDRTRSAWSEARGRLAELVIQGKLSPYSATVATLYPLQTFVLNNPNRYGEIAERLQAVFTGPPGQTDGTWLSEKATWPREMDDVVERMERAIRHLMIFYPTHAGGLVRLALKRAPRWARQALWRRVGSFIRAHSTRWESFHIESVYIEMQQRVATLSNSLDPALSLTNSLLQAPAGGAG